MFAARGVPVVDADALLARGAGPGQPAHADIAAAWPEAVARRRALDRKRLGDIVFADPAAPPRLEAITHPPHPGRCRARGPPRWPPPGTDLAIYEASLLVESGRDRSSTASIVVTASPATQLARVVARDGAARRGRPRPDARPAAPGGQGPPRDPRHRQRRRPRRDRGAGRTVHREACDHEVPSTPRSSSSRCWPRSAATFRRRSASTTILATAAGGGARPRTRRRRLRRERVMMVVTGGADRGRRHRRSILFKVQR